MIRDHESEDDDDGLEGIGSGAVMSSSSLGLENRGAS